MAGGIFKKSAPKTRPGTYVNVVNGKQPTAANSPTGIGMIPLIGYDWGPRDEFIHISADSPDAQKALFGRSVYDDNPFMLLLRLMLLKASEIYVWIPGSGKKATGSIAVTKDEQEGTATATAKYAGELGNKLKVVSVANPIGGFDVSVVLDGRVVEGFEGAKTVADLTGSSYIDFAGEGNLTAFASASLSGGEDDKESMNGSVTKFLDAAEKIKFNCMAFPSSDEALITALITKIKYIRNNIGWKCGAVVAKTAADYEGIYNLTNGFVYEGVELSEVQATAWLAGAVAGADYITSLTYAPVTGATGLVGEKTNEESIQAIKNGETFFSLDESGNVILEYDHNSKVTFSEEDPTDIGKGRPCRVYDTFANELLLTFVPGRFDNNPTGQTVMEGLGRAMLQAYEKDGAIKNVDLENDFKVDQGASVGDSVFINVGIQAVDSAEKYYFTVVAR